MKSYTQFIKENLSKKEFIILVGPPGVGKSYYINKINKDGRYVVMNRDDIATEVAEEKGLTYRDLFVKPNYLPSDGSTYLGTVKTEYVPDYYIEDGKKYVRGFEKYGEVIDVSEDHPSFKWTKIEYKMILELNDEVTRRYDEKFENALNNNKSIIMDATSVYKDARAYYIRKLGDKRQEYIVKAVVFNKGCVGMEDTILNINKKRDALAKKGREKFMPPALLNSFIKRYEEPSTGTEDIDVVEHIDNRKDLEKFINEQINLLDPYNEEDWGDDNKDIYVIYVIGQDMNFLCKKKYRITNTRMGWRDYYYEMAEDNNGVINFDSHCTVEYAYAAEHQTDILSGKELIGYIEYPMRVRFTSLKNLCNKAGIDINKVIIYDGRN